MDTLRNELIQSQKVRSDLLKWKLLIVSGVGGAALGFSGRNPSSAHLALAVLPLACAYVDLLCRHLSLRNKVIGLFFREYSHSSPDLRNYESFYKNVNKAWGASSLESLALLGLTAFVSIVIVPVGILSGDNSWAPWSWPAGLFYASGVVGLVVSIFIQKKYTDLAEDAESTKPRIWLNDSNVDVYEK